MVEEIRVMGLTLFSGLGPSQHEGFQKGLSWGPDVIVAQGTSLDSGPAYTGGDISHLGCFATREAQETVIVSAKRKGIPFILSTGGPAGGNRRLEEEMGVVDTISRAANIKLRVAVIPGGLDKGYLKQKIRSGAKIRRLIETERLSEYLTEEEVDRSEHIIAQMGPEVIMKALDFDVDGVIAGRSLDIGLHMALPLKRGFTNKGLVAHMAKTMECGGMVADPSSPGPIFGILRKDDFLIRSPVPNSKCTPVSVVAHSFYERANPNLEENPGGALDISNAKYEQYDEQTVRVSGARWIPKPYTLKIEGARLVGYRNIAICGVRDERMIRNIDWCLDQTRKHIKDRFPSLKPGEDYELIFRVYGKNGVLGELEPIKEMKSHELGLILEVIGREQAIADDIIEIMELFILFIHYPGRQSIAGNIALPYSPQEIRLGPVYVWNIWHLLELDDPCEPFKIKIREFPTK